MRICPVCKNKFSKGKWTVGMFHTHCPHCNAHLKLAFDWRIIPLIILFCVAGAYCSIHWIFKAATIVVGVLIFIYLSNLPYDQV